MQVQHDEAIYISTVTVANERIITPDQTRSVAAIATLHPPATIALSKA